MIIITYSSFDNELNDINIIFNGHIKYSKNIMLRIKLFRTIELGVDEYMSQLDLQSVSLDDSGMYVCFVTSLGAGGFSVKSSFIHVIESKIFF